VQVENWPGAPGDPEAVIARGLDGCQWQSRLELGDRRRPGEEAQADEISGLCPAFAARIRKPPLAYLTRWRMTVACRGFRAERWSVGEAARRAGYRSEPAFSRAFRRSVGVSPARYRSAALTPIAVAGEASRGRA
jgi:Helix-turn-helix domain